MALLEKPRESGPSLTQEPQRDVHVKGRLRELLGASIERDIYLSTEEAAQYVGRPTRAAFIKWCRRCDPPIPLRRAYGKKHGPMVVRKSDLDWALRPR